MKFFFPQKGALEKMAVAVAFGNHDELQSLVHAAPATAPWVSNRRGFRVSLPDLLGGGETTYFFMFTPKIGEDEPIFDSYFFRWVETTN